jgi:DNA-directed RNA polymerase sigma subunit (sigma70/sigma32)
MTPDLQISLERLLKDVFGDQRYNRAKLRINDAVAFTVMQMMDTLEIREIVCLCLKYGITEERMDLKTIAQNIAKVKNPDVKIGPARAREIVARAVRKMRHPVRLRRLIATLEKNSDLGIRSVRRILEF